MPYKNSSSEYFTCKRILSCIVIVSFMIHHMLRLNISIAIVEMAFHNNSNDSVPGPRYHWNEEEKNEILGSFFWGYFIMQIPGGRLAEIFGPRIVVGSGLFPAALLTILTPVSCRWGFYWVLLVRFALGVSLGVQWASVPPLAAKWVPSTDTSKFMAHMMASSLGSALTLPICGHLIANYGWPSVFYVTGTIALLCTMAWFYLAYDSPEQHPRISDKEREALRGKVYRSQIQKNVKTPWVKILSSGPVWALIVGNSFSTFTVFIALFQMPSYINQVLHMNIMVNGWLSGLPHLVRYTCAVISSYLADKAIKKGRFSRTTIRKACNTIAFLGSALLFTIQAIWGYNWIVSVIVFTGSFAMLSFTTPGILANCVDIAPAYSGTLLGLSHLPACAFGYFSTKIVGLFTKDEQTFQQWSYIFWIVVGVHLFAAIFFIAFGSGEVQSWHPKIVEDAEMHQTRNEQDQPLTSPS